jgi:hypothetical protein
MSFTGEDGDLLFETALETLMNAPQYLRSAKPIAVSTADDLELESDQQTLERLRTEFLKRNRFA